MTNNYFLHFAGSWHEGDMWKTNKIGQFFNNSFHIKTKSLQENEIKRFTKRKNIAIKILMLFYSNIYLTIFFSLTLIFLNLLIFKKISLLNNQEIIIPK